MRLFVGVPLPDVQVAALERLQEDLPVGRLVDPEGLHVTLAFLDEVSPTLAEAVHEGLEAIRAVPFTLRLRGIEVFGGDTPRVIWAGIEPEPVLSALRDKVRRVAEAAGIALHRERFRPHVTLARFSGRLQAGEAEKLARFLTRNGAFDGGRFEVGQITLFRSLLRPDGAQYEALAEYPLRP